MTSYAKSAKILHWLMAFLIIFLLCLGFYMTQILPKEAANRMDIYNLHKSLGVLVIFLFFARIINRHINKAPAPLENLQNWEKISSKITHILLYLLMFIIPVSGYLMSNSYGYAVKFFGIEMPFLIEKNYEIGPIFGETHEVAAFTIIGLIILHIGAVLKHKFIDKKDVLKRMI